MIRPAVPADRSVLREMFDEFYSSGAVLHPLPASCHEAALDELFSGGTAQRCFLLTEGDAAAGYALLSPKYSHEAGGAELWLEELYLRPDFRGKGAGGAFFTFLKEYGAEQGYKRLRLEVKPDNAGALRLYARMGFRPLGYRQMVWEEET